MYWMVIQSMCRLWRTSPQFCKVFPPSWYCNQVLKKPFYHSIMVNSEFQDYDPIDILFLLLSEFLTQKQHCVKYQDSG